MTDIARAQELFFAALDAQNSKRLGVAEDLYRRALALAPDRPSIINNLATVLQQQGKFTEADAYCKRLLELAPEDAHAWVLDGNTRSGLGEWPEALASYGRALALAPDHVQALLSRGHALATLGRPEQALLDLDRALRLAPEQAAVLIGRGSVLTELGRFPAAIDACQRALAMEPDNPEFLCVLANAMLRAQQPQAAITACERAISLAPDMADAFQNRGNALVMLGRHRDALADYARAQSLAPGSARPRWNEALCRLLLGDFERGWALYDAGWEIGQRGQQKPVFTQPAWNGEYVDGVLLAWGEQGIGDQILFSSMLEQLRLRARRLLVAVDERLVPLLRRSYSDIDVVPRDALPTLHGFDVQVAMGDLGLHLRRNRDSFPQHRTAFLHADPQRSRQLRAELGAERRLLCGVSWRSTNPALGGMKSLALADLAGLLALPDVQGVDLQYGETGEERRALQQASGITLAHVDSIDNFRDIDALAALIDACDIVVSVSNTTVHLAGALGKPTLVMLPFALGRIWYWHEGRERSPWYPACRLLRQTASGAWAPVIDAATTIVAVHHRHAGKNN